jgi:hypothetical protein
MAPNICADRACRNSPPGEGEVAEVPEDSTVAKVETEPGDVGVFNH